MAFKYSNVQHKHHGVNKKTHKVHISGNNGYKCVTHFCRGKKSHHSKKQLTKCEINMIKKGKFIKGLFKDCGKNVRSTRKNR
jgi:hypothetical protein